MVCHNCRIEAKKAGKRPDGMQRYRCAQCGKTFSERKEFGLIGHKQAVDEHRALLALTLLAEGNSIRSAQRISGIDNKTIMKLLVFAGERCEALLAARVRGVRVQDVQADEIWGFVGKKEGNKDHGDTPYVGNAWCFIAIERTSKLILAFEVGKRTVTSATKFIEKLATATDPETRFQLTTDGLKPTRMQSAISWGSRGLRATHQNLHAGDGGRCPPLQPRAIGRDARYASLRQPG